MARALNAQLLPPTDVLSTLSKVLPDLQPEQGIVRYPLLRIVNQAITFWRPSPTLSNDISLLWTIEKLLHSFISREDLRRDHVLFIETLDVWTNLLTSKFFRPVLKAERGENSSISDLLR